MMNDNARRGAWASALVYVALTAVMGRHVLGSLGTMVAGDNRDSMLNAAILAWNANSVPWSDAWYQFPIYYPLSDALTFSEHLLGLSIIATPLYWMTGNGLAAYNLTMLLTYPLSALAMYALIWRLTRSAPAAFLSGLAFGFAPYRAGHLGHIQLLAVFWAPLALLGLHEYVETRRRRWLLLFGVGWALQGAANGYLLVYFSVLIGFWVLWFLVARRRWREAALVAGAGAAAVLPLLPIIYRYVTAHARYALSRGPGEQAFYGADITAPLCPPPGLTFWGWLGGNCRPEGELFIGPTLVALCFVGAWATRRRQDPGDHQALHHSSSAAFYALAAVAAWALSWGPAPRFRGVLVLSGGPFAWLGVLPGVDQLRVPARFWMVTLLSLSILLGLLVAAMLKRRSAGASAAIVVAASLGLALDGWMTIPAAALPPPAPNPKILPGKVVMTLPIGAEDSTAEFRAVVGGWSVANGASGYFAPHYTTLWDASDRADPIVFAPFLSRGDLHVVVDENKPALVDLVERQAGVEETGRGGGRRQYRIPRRGTVTRGTPGGERRPIASVSASCAREPAAWAIDGDGSTRWQCGLQTSDQAFTIDLGVVTTAGALVHALGAYRNDYPRHLIVETSIDQMDWQEAWNGDVLAPVFEARVRDPQSIRFVVPFAPRPARFVRLRQVGRDEEWYWSIAEVEVWSGM
jgi:hypothetical protein